MRKIFIPLLISISFFGCTVSTGDKGVVTQEEGVAITENEDVALVEEKDIVITAEDKVLAEEYKNSGNAKRDLLDYKGAIEDYTKAIELNPNYADAYYTRGITKIAVGDKVGGCTDLSKAEELGHSRANGKVKQYCN